jgi:hypothetical protein
MHERDPLARGLGNTLLRRLLLEPLVLLVAALALALAPALLLLAALGDLVRGRWALPWLRAATFAVFYALVEAGGLLALGLAWLGYRWRSREAWLAANYTLGKRWGRLLLYAFHNLFSLRLEIEGRALLAPGPAIVFPRHVSLADTLLPMVVSPLMMRPRYVMKAALRLDPVLDTLGSRTPNAFVERGSGEPASQIARVAALAGDLGSRDMIVIFPEGTRFTPERRERILERLEEAGDAERLARAQALTHTLPPRLGGPMALLDALPGADVVFMAHTGFEGLTHLQDLLDGSMVGARVCLRVWRVPASQIPAEREARARWLYAQWADLDAWVGANT